VTELPNLAARRSDSGHRRAVPSATSLRRARVRRRYSFRDGGRGESFEHAEVIYATQPTEACLFCRDYPGAGQERERTKLGAR